MSKFKVGDKVLLTGNYDLPDGLPSLPAAIIHGVDRDGDYILQFTGCTTGHNANEHHSIRKDLWFAGEHRVVAAPVVAVKPDTSKLHPSDKVILKHLKKRGSISPMEALASYSCARLAPRIFNLRQAGYPISTKINQDAPGHRYARYTLEKAA